MSAGPAATGSTSDGAGSDGAGVTADRPVPGPGGTGWPAWPSSPGGGSRATTRSTSSGLTPSSTRRCSCPRPSRCTATGSGCGCAAWSTCPATAPPWSSRTTRACCRWTRSCSRPGVFADHPAHRNLRLLGADLVYELPGLAGLARRSGHTRADPACARAAAGGRRAGRACSPRASRASASRSASGTSCSGSAAAGSPAPRSRARRADDPVRDRRRRGDLPDDRQRRAGPPGCCGCPISRSPRCSPGSGRSGAVPLPSNWIIEFCAAGADVRLRRPRARMTRRSSATLADQVRDTIQDKVDELVAERGPAFG